MAYTYRYKVVDWRVIDGDTVAMTLDLGFFAYTKQSCRLLGIDTPEHSTAAGKLVSDVLALWMSRHSPLVVVSVKLDKYAARFDAIVWDLANKHSANEYLLEQELAKPYAGDKKPPWLKKELKAVELKAKQLLAV